MIAGAGFFDKLRFARGEPGQIITRYSARAAEAA